MGLLNRLERSLGRFAIPNLSLYLVMGQVLFWSLSFLLRFDLDRIQLAGAAVTAGEFWRVFTFMLYPPKVHPVFLAFAWYMFWMMGSALEKHWGDFRFNLFLLLGWALTVAVAFAYPEYYVTNVFLAASVFLAFAFLNPDFELLLFFILPVKIKWMALVMWLGFAYEIFTEPRPVKFMVMASVANFLIFFAGPIVQRMRTGRRQMEQRSRRAAMREEASEPRHRCHVCGKTEVTHPQLDFRYCSKCAGEECYCSEHIGNHPHTVAPAKK
jgi:hypothetical protein